MRATLVFLFSFITLLTISVQGYCQEDDIEETRLYYMSDKSGGLLVHTNGFGAFFRQGKRINGFKKRILSAEIVNMKHIKEAKSFNPYNEDAKGFVYGKLNSLLVLRPSIGIQKTLYSKETKRGVQVGYTILVGPAIGLLKPIYLEIASPNIVSYETRTIERYDPNKHSIDMIYGRAAATRGIEETKIYPGLHAKFGFNFEYAPEDEMIRAIEVGVSADAFYKTVPIMATFNGIPDENQPQNHQVYLTIYMHWQLGKKFYQ
jgi:hypothetical protein